MSIVLYIVLAVLPRHFKRQLLRLQRPELQEWSTRQQSNVRVRRIVFSKLADVVGCDTTGTELSTIFTLAPYWSATLENWDDCVSDRDLRYIVGNPDLVFVRPNHVASPPISVNNSTILWHRVFYLHILHHL
ncbi:hypothetical protein VMCG_02016 [Cytospora schulzeri]|uniref:Uncharacterized protein n=1 Tax=Cytospora schulzeri TaxID=448051 RepID=A0A423X3V2_9PEZI|nr:hypothetical protein VMCG_02016 [Valsa malicola]